MQTLEEMTQGFLALGISPEHAQLAAAKQYAALIEQKEAAGAETRKAADEAAGVDLWCGVRCSGISYLDKDGRKVVSPMLRNAKALEDGIGYEPAKTGAPTDGGLPPYYPPKIWIMQRGSKPQCLSQYEIAGIVKAIEQHGTDKVVEILRQVGSVEALETFKAEKAKGIKEGRYQDTDNKRNRRK